MQYECFGLHGASCSIGASCCTGLHAVRVFRVVLGFMQYGCFVLYWASCSTGVSCCTGLYVMHGFVNYGSLVKYGKGGSCSTEIFRSTKSSRNTRVLCSTGSTEQQCHATRVSRDCATGWRKSSFIENFVFNYFMSINNFMCMFVLSIIKRLFH